MCYDVKATPSRLSLFSIGLENFPEKVRSLHKVPDHTSNSHWEMEHPKISCLLAKKLVTSWRACPHHINISGVPLDLPPPAPEKIYAPLLNLYTVHKRIQNNLLFTHHSSKFFPYFLIHLWSTVKPLLFRSWAKPVIKDTFPLDWGITRTKGPWNDPYSTATCNPHNVNNNLQTCHWFF